MLDPALEIAKAIMLVLQIRRRASPPRILRPVAISGAAAVASSSVPPRSTSIHPLRLFNSPSTVALPLRAACSTSTAQSPPHDFAASRRGREWCRRPCPAAV
ncbi:hypothetical protein DFH06DRAFT_1341792 [Mycena polygramma]|nr:hypothetical protein DFH06DRAFT_1341792 [Mycena polygramma]